jgi:hypothetical protein
MKHGKVFVPGENLFGRSRVPDVARKELVAFRIRFGDAVKILVIARMHAGIHVGDEFRLIMLEDIPNKIAAQKPGAADDKESHAVGSSRDLAAAATPNPDVWYQWIRATV